MEPGADTEIEVLLLFVSFEVTTERVRRDEGRKKERYKEKSKRQADIMKQKERKRARNEHNKKANFSVSCIHFNDAIQRSVMGIYTDEAFSLSSSLCAVMSGAREK